MHSLDGEVLLPVLERVSRGAITVQHDKQAREWYSDDGRRCLFATYLFQALVELNYIYWDSMIGEPGKLRVRQDGIWAVKLDDKGHQMLKRLRETADRDAKLLTHQ